MSEAGTGNSEHAVSSADLTTIATIWHSNYAGGEKADWTLEFATNGDPGSIRSLFYLDALNTTYQDHHYV